MGRAPGVTKEPVLRAFPGQGPGINTPWAEIKPISKLCSLRPREVQWLGLEGGQPGSDQQPHSRCPQLLLPPSGLSPTGSPGSGPGRGRAPGRLGAIPGLMGLVSPLVRPHVEVSAPKEKAAPAHGVQQRAVGGAQRSLPEERVPELPGPPAPGGQAPPGRAQSAGLSPPAPGPPLRPPGATAGDREARGARAAPGPAASKGSPRCEPRAGPLPPQPCAVSPRQPHAACLTPPIAPGCPGAQPSVPLTPRTLSGRPLPAPWAPKPCPLPSARLPAAS